MDWTNIKTVVMVVIAIVLISTLGGILASNQLTAKQSRYCETYDDTTTYNESNNICYEATNTSNTASPIANTGFDLFSDIMLYVVLGAVITFMVGIFLKKKMA